MAIVSPPLYLHQTGVPEGKLRSRNNKIWFWCKNGFSNQRFTCLPEISPHAGFIATTTCVPHATCPSPAKASVMQTKGELPSVFELVGCNNSHIPMKAAETKARVQG